MSQRCGFPTHGSGLRASRVPSDHGEDGCGSLSQRPWPWEGCGPELAAGSSSRPPEPTGNCESGHLDDAAFTERRVRFWGPGTTSWRQVCSVHPRAKGVGVSGLVPPRDSPLHPGLPPAVTLLHSSKRRRLLLPRSAARGPRHPQGRHKGAPWARPWWVCGMERSEAPAGLAVTVLDKRPGRGSAAEPPAPGSGLRTWTPSAYARNSGGWGALDGLLGCRPLHVSFSYICSG